MGQNADFLEYEADAQSRYEKAVHLMETGQLTIKPSLRKEIFEQAADLMRQAGSYADAARQASVCDELAGKAAADEAAERVASVKRRMEDPDFDDYDKLIRELEEAAKAGGTGDASVREIPSLLEKCRQLKAHARRRRRIRKGTISAILLILAAALIWCFTSGYINNIKGFVYRKAGMDSYALASYEKLGDRFGAARKYLSCELEGLSGAQPGDLIHFGKLKWRVLEKNEEDQNVTLIASEIPQDSPLKEAAFDEGGRETTWASSALRAWLNDELPGELFSEEERAKLIAYPREASANEAYGTAYDEETSDLLAPPSLQELEAWAEEAGNAGDCYLRTPGHDLTTVAYITSGGQVMPYGVPADTALCVRPVIRVAFEGEQF